MVSKQPISISIQRSLIFKETRFLAAKFLGWKTAAALQRSFVTLPWFIAPFSLDKATIRFCPPSSRFLHLFECMPGR